MDCWQQLKQQLLQLLKNHQVVADQAITQYQFCIALPPDCANVLAWLKGQPHYPRFFWQARESESQCVALGEVQRFSQLDAAQQFLNQHADQPLHLVGGLTFEGEASFYLPRLWLEQCAERLKVTFSLSATDRQSAVYAFIERLQGAQTLNAVTAGLYPGEQNYNQIQWQDLVQESLDCIAQGRFTKVVLAQKKTFALSEALDPHDLLAQARRQQPCCYYFLWAQSAQSAFLGISPERLYRRQRQTLFTEALAGTAEYGGDQRQNQQQQQWLLQDGKNIHENRLVVEDICAKLSNLSQHLDIGELSSRTLRYVQHLVRNIGAKLYPEVDDQACLSAIHPSAAVGGLPYAAALKFIAERQNFKRDWYAGTLGVMSLASSEFCVAIRSTLLSKDPQEQDKIAIFAGAGIVAGSVPLLEWQEIERKAAGILSLFPT
ncbi:isochorismate synthase [Pasteurella testudinis]|uniref:isochorismate synthase n=1 Tax=Pasteurella testudinis TaxID=761 RepID=UPI004058EC4B